MTDKTTGRTVLVTGASRGLGLALTRALARRGDAVLVDARDEAALRSVTAHLAKVTSVAGDINDPQHRDALAARVHGRRLDAVVLNAGTLGPSPLPPVSQLDTTAFADVLQTNVVAQLAVLQTVLEHLRPGGAVLAITSDAATTAYEGWGAYAASKAALEQLMAVFAAERPDLRVYRVDPGDLRTAMQQAAYPGEDISDRPLPETAVPGLLSLIDGRRPSGRYEAAGLSPAADAAVEASESEATHPGTADLARVP